MANVFISYGRADRDKAGRLVELLEEQGLSIWRDDHLRCDWVDEEIRKQISAADAVVALLSRDALASDWVRGEMERAGVKLIPAQIEPFAREELPTPLLPRDILDLTDWHGESDHPELIKLFACCHDLARTSPPPPARRAFQGNQGTSSRSHSQNTTENHVHIITGNSMVVMGSGGKVVTYAAPSGVPGPKSEDRDNLGRPGRGRKS